MGLLQKATEHNTNTPEVRNIFLPEIEKKLSQVKNTIEFYPLLFKEVVKLFSIEKGALLIREENMFSLSSIIGFDETTKHRLRLSVNEYKKFKENNNKDIIKQYLSIREYITLNNLLIIPFTNNNKVESLLLITEFSIENTPKRDELEETALKLSHLFSNNPLHKLKVIETQTNNKKEDITYYVQKIKNSDNRIIFLKLNLDHLMAKFKENETLSTSSSIKSSAIKILNSFVKNKGKVFQLSNNDILLTLLDNHGSANAIVIQQQISAAFKSIFSNKLSTIDLNYETLIWQNNSLDTILEHFIQDAPTN